MMAPVSTPPGLSLPEPLSEDSIIELDSATQLRAPPGLFLPPGLTLIPEEKEAAAPEIKRSVFSIADHLDMEDDDVVIPRHTAPLCPAPVVAGVGSYRELQKSLFEKEKLEKKMMKLHKLVTCVENIAEQVEDQSTKQVQPARASVWSKKESSKYPGKFYYLNSETGKTTWTKPDDFDVAKESPPAKALPGKKMARVVSDYDGSTDAGSSSDDAGDFARSVSSRASSQRTAASMSNLRADAPALQCSKVMKSVARSLAQANILADFEIDQAMLKKSAASIETH